MDCWHRQIERSRTEADVVRNAGDFMSLWSPRELAPVTHGWREVAIENVDDLERVKKWVVDDLGAEISVMPEAEPLRELGDYLWHATARIKEIRSN